MKEKYELEYLFKTSAKVLENLIFMPSGLTEWFADDVKIRDDIYSFDWNGSIEQAKLLNKSKASSKIRWQWVDDAEDNPDAYFEISFIIAPMTNAVVLKIVDFAEEDDFEDSKLLWDQAVQDLKRVLGA
tara:strand:+ start:367 stop:753 length:387 start_codon:yes stop_codon:yes gene_type:complete